MPGVQCLQREGSGSSEELRPQAEPSLESGASSKERTSEGCRPQFRAGDSSIVDASPQDQGIPAFSRDDFLWENLKDLPGFRALLRAVEARFYQDLLPLEAPVLDVGCGDGHFASVAFHRPLAAGIDPESAVLGEARDRGAYRVLAQGLGNALPYADRYFATVISNSVLEHIPQVDDVLAEIARVLQPGGRFIFCVPGDHFTELLLFAQLFRRLRLEALAVAYQRYFDRISRHHHCDSPQVWQDRLEAAGLHLNEYFYYFSARATHALDLGHYYGVPSLVAKKLFGRWILAPTRWNLALTERWLRPLYEEPLPQIGAYLFFVAQSL